MHWVPIKTGIQPSQFSELFIIIVIVVVLLLSSGHVSFGHHFIQYIGLLELMCSPSRTKPKQQT
jgi:hypothetical protein